MSSSRSVRISPAEDMLRNEQRRLDWTHRRLAQLEEARRELLAEKARVERAIADERLNSRAHANQMWADTPGLVELLAVMLTGHAMTVREATEALLAVGYRSSSKDFKRLVGQRLHSSGRFVRVAPGVFTAR